MSNNLRMDDGFSTLIQLSLAPTIKLWEKDVTPPGITSGGPIETTTMRNTTMRTNAPRQLKALTQVSATVAYATVAIETVINTLIGVNQLVTIDYPDGSHLQFWGWVEEFTPATHTEGEQPTANLVVQPSNRDSSGAEFTPAYYEPDETPA